MEDPKDTIFLISGFPLFTKRNPRAQNSFFKIWFTFNPKLGYPEEDKSTVKRKREKG